LTEAAISVIADCISVVEVASSWVFPLTVCTDAADCSTAAAVSFSALENCVAVDSTC
jgi:hypothetical protein